MTRRIACLALVLAACGGGVTVEDPEASSGQSGAGGGSSGSGAGASVATSGATSGTAGGGASGTDCGSIQHQGTCTTLCNGISPMCGPGMTAQSNGSCWTGWCIPLEVCGDASL